MSPRQWGFHLDRHHAGIGTSRRDSRQQIQVFEFDKNVKTIEDLTEGMELPGIVNNITNFGCFVDIGIKEKGLVHVSQLADKFVSDPTTVVSIHQHVRVKVMSIDFRAQAHPAHYERIESTPQTKKEYGRRYRNLRLVRFL